MISLEPLIADGLLSESEAGDPDLFGAGRDMTEMLSIHLSPDGRWLVVFASHGWINNEIYARDLQAPAGAFVPVVTGRDALFYGPVRGNTLYLLTNWEAPQYRVLAAQRPGARSSA